MTHTIHPSITDDRLVQELWDGPLAIALCDDEGVVVKINETFNGLMGYGLHGLDGKHFREFTLPTDADVDQKEFGRLISGEVDYYTMTKTWITKLGLQLTGRMHVSRVGDDVMFTLAQIIESVSPDQMAAIAAVADARVDKRLDEKTNVQPDVLVVAPRTLWRLIYDFGRDHPWAVPVVGYLSYLILDLFFGEGPSAP